MTGGQLTTIFNYRTYPQGHGPTNVTRWLEEKNGGSINKEEDDKSYDNSIKYVNRFEPYSIFYWPHFRWIWK
jgi:hypothetical protein